VFFYDDILFLAWVSLVGNSSILTFSRERERNEYDSVFLTVLGKRDTGYGHNFYTQRCSSF